jgi:Uma2 family endonuclease
VLSPTTERTDKMTKLPEYMRHPTLKTIAPIEPGKMGVLVYQRDEAGGWQGKRYKRPTDEIYSRVPMVG